MPRTLLAASLLALGAAGPAGAQTVYPDAGKPDPAFAPYGMAVWRGLQEVCLPAASGREPLRSNPDVTPVRFPPEWAVRAVAIGPGAPAYGQWTLPKGTLLFATTPGRLCQELVLDAPTGGRIFITLDAMLRDHGWRLTSRDDRLETSRRTYQIGGSGRPGADVEVREFVDGGGPVGHIRLSLTLKSYP